MVLILLTIMTCYLVKKVNVSICECEEALHTVIFNY